MYLPIKDSFQFCSYDEVAPGTHIIIANSLPYLIFNRYQMTFLVHCEAKRRLADMDWGTSVQNLHNWADKGDVQLNLLILAIKKIALLAGTKCMRMNSGCATRHTARSAIPI